MLKAVVRGEDRRVVHYGYEKWAGTKKKGSSYPGSWACSLGLKQAFVTSRNSIRASPPSLVPNSEDKERSGATDAR